MASKIFISYSRKDFDVVIAMRNEIQRRTGVLPWMDVSGIETGARFSAVIAEAIEGCELLVFVILHHSVNSPWTRKEVLYAQENQKKIYPVVLDDAKLPPELRFLLVDLNRVDYRDEVQRMNFFVDLERETMVSLDAHDDEGGDACTAYSTQPSTAPDANHVVRRKAREKPPSTEPEHAAGEVKILTLPGGAEMELVWCPPGEFMMGSPQTEEGRSIYETQHCVRLTNGFWMGKYPVTQRQWKSVMGRGQSHFKGDDLPVESVSWNDIQAFIKKVNEAFQYGARLPTEAEWEYACRAGTATAYSWGNALNGDKANCAGTKPYGTSKRGPYLKKTSPVGKYGANPWGLYDMHGNVYEWCVDRYGSYPAGRVVDPQGPALGDQRVLRGGCWESFARDCRSAHRAGRRSGFRHERYGFRLCCSALPNDDR